ncbi:M48 family metalloprotease [Cocleimonas sp. KMM 6892]|uniref:M48 family metalloprotease n=1 Tax=unclassified Cocleimonas TaxID=2639732 RepID=UPI002DB73ED0|nr:MULTISPECIES: M48 family metalloprotease [unclassified Cocleimonas]MEB8431544.1 M48 family metalloprotease [Cocleimonas sp. KMM 6892]MEC4713684.1 M48 family metalloprotease [Cocleimonas sp. KMM 6895]MEC4743015.1 M48 family metalloprotease [Cocleimonas sp. KMM 6896]
MNKLNTLLLSVLLSTPLLLSSSVKADLNLELPDFNLPQLGGHTGSIAASIKERETGLDVLRSLRARGLLIEDPEVNLWIRSLGNRLTARAPSSPNPFYFVVARDTAINAFATLGGVIVINSGLILNTSSESELAAVLSHEIAHVTQRHIPRMIEKAKNNKFATGAALLAGVIAATKDSQAGGAIINATLATTAHQQLAFGREAEAEADRVGLRILASAGLNPQGMPKFLQKLEEYGDSKTAEIREFLQNHPLTIKRVSDTSVRASQFGVFKGKENISYQYMREKVRSLANTTSRAPVSVSAQIKNYSNILLLRKQGAFQQAYNLAENQLSTKNISEAALYAELAIKQRQYNKAISILLPLSKIYPGNEVIAIPLSQAYISLGQIEPAWKIIREIHTTEQTSLEFFEVLQELSRLRGNSSYAYRAVAERNIRTGHYQSARIQLTKAMRLPGSNVNELQEMRQMLDQIKHKKVKKGN